MKTKYKGLLIKRKENTNLLIFEKIEIERTKSLEMLYKYLECDKIDIQERIINNKIYDFIFDDEYLINGKSQKSENIIAVGNRNGEILEIIFGSLVIVGQANENGEETDIKQNDIDNILNSLEIVINKTNGERYQVLNYCFELKERNTKSDDK